MDLIFPMVTTKCLPFLNVPTGIKYNISIPAHLEGFHFYYFEYVLQLHLFQLRKLCVKLLMGLASDREYLKPWNLFENNKTKIKLWNKNCDISWIWTYCKTASNQTQQKYEALHHLSRFEQQRTVRSILYGFSRVSFYIADSFLLSHCIEWFEGDSNWNYCHQSHHHQYAN